MDITFLPFRGARVSRKTWFVLTTKTVSGGANRGVNRPVGFRKPHLFLNDECESTEAMGIAWLHGTDQEQSGPTPVESWSTTEAIQRSWDRNRTKRNRAHHGAAVETQHVIIGSGTTTRVWQ